MPITKQLSSRVNAKQLTGADLPQNPALPTTNKYVGVSTGGQTIINLPFAVSQTNTDNFILTIDGKILTLGAANDFTFASIQSNNTSSQIALNYSLIANLNIQAIYLGILQPQYSASSLSTVQAQANTATALAAKNYLINGAFDYWQRSTSNTIANTVSTYVADRWYVKNSLGTNGVITCSRQTGVINGSKYGCQVQITTAPTVSQANGTELYQVIENMNSIELYGQNASFSAWIKALGNVNQIGLQFFYATSEVKLTTAIGSEQLVTVNSGGFSLGEIVNQALGTSMTTDGVVGVRIRITGVSSGNLYDLNNGFIVEQAMLNQGSTVGTFSRAGRNTQEELAMCQRYYETGFTSSGGYADSTSLLVSGSTFYKVTKKSAPTITASNVSSMSWSQATIFDSPLTFNAQLSSTVNSFAIRTNNPNSRAAGSAGTMAYNWLVDVDI